MSPRVFAPLAVLLLLAGGALGMWVKGGNPSPPRLPAPEPTAPAPPGTAALLSADPGAHKPIRRVQGVPIGNRGPAPENAVVFPDGTWLMPLNGVEKAPPFPGFPRSNFVPVVKIVGDPRDGSQWYLHADGTYSTTQMVPCTDAQGREFLAPGWAVGTPVPTQPIR